MAAYFTCSVDDGFPSDLRFAELLLDRKLPGTFYIPIRNREGLEVMTPAQIRDLASSFEVGSHTYDHCYLSDVRDEAAREQIKDGKKSLENIVGKQVFGFCYPGGKYRSEHAGMVKAAGFRYARTTVNLSFDSGNNRFEMPTTCQFFPHERNVYVRNFVKCGQWKRRFSGLRVALAEPEWIHRLHALLDFCCKQDGVFHLWAHSWEIDRLNAWHELGDFLTQVAEVIPVENRMQNWEIAERSFRVES